MSEVNKVNRVNKQIEGCSIEENKRDREGGRVIHTLAHNKQKTITDVAVELKLSRNTHIHI